MWREESFKIYIPAPLRHEWYFFIFKFHSCRGNQSYAFIVLLSLHLAICSISLSPTQSIPLFLFLSLHSFLHSIFSIDSSRLNCSTVLNYSKSDMGCMIAPPVKVFVAKLYILSLISEIQMMQLLQFVLSPSYTHHSMCMHTHIHTQKYIKFLNVIKK